MASRPSCPRRELAVLALVLMVCGVATALSAPTSLLAPVAGLSVATAVVATARWWRRRRRD